MNRLRMEIGLNGKKFPEYSVNKNGSVARLREKLMPLMQINHLL